MIWDDKETQIQKKRNWQVRYISLNFTSYTAIHSFINNLR